MAKKKTTTTETVEDEEDGSGRGLLETGARAVDEATLDASIAALDELRAIGGDDVISWTVAKIASKPGERGGYCARYASGDLNLDTIRETFGGGKYRIKGTDNAGKWVLGASRTIEIMDLPRPPTAPNTPTPGFGDLASILQAVKPSGDGNADMFKLIIAMMDNNAKMFAAMMERPRQETTLADTLALIKETRENKDGASDAVKLLMQGLELGQKLGGGETGLMDIAAKGLDMIQPLITAQANAPPAPKPGPAIAAPATPGAPSTPAPNAPRATPEVDPMLQKLNWLRHQTRVLVYQAARDSDPALYAALMLDNLPAFVTEEEIFERISAPDALVQLATLDSRVSSFAPWFERFRAAVLEQFSEEGEEGEIDTPGAGMDGADDTGAEMQP